MNNIEFTDVDVAEWMQIELINKKELRQDDAASEIAKNFGEKFTYENVNGNLAISPKVLREFDKLMHGRKDWDSGEKTWYLIGN